MTSQQMIARSINHTEIVTAPWTQDAHDRLLDVCEGMVATQQRVEFWGTQDGDEWRVHLSGVILSARRYEDYDDCLAAAVSDVAEDLGVPESSCSAEWLGGDDGERASIVVAY